MSELSQAVDRYCLRRINERYGLRLGEKYESLVQDCVSQLRSICDFVGISADERFLQAAAESCSFANLHAKESVSGMCGDWPRNKPFFRRGVVGSHRDELEAAFLDDFLGDARLTLLELEYL
jgi:hypothetical protein